MILNVAKSTLCAALLIISFPNNTYAQMETLNEIAYPINIGEGISPSLSRTIGCFSVITGNSESSNSTYNLSIFDKETSYMRSSTVAQSASLSASAQSGISSGSASVAWSNSRSHDYIRNSRSISAVLDVDVSTGRDYTTAISLSELGKDWLAKGSYYFIKNCGAYIVTSDNRSIRIRAIVDFTFESESERDKASQSLQANLGGKYGTFSASASFSKKLDNSVANSSKKTNVKISVSQRAQNGVSGLAEMTAAISEIEEHPFETLLNAIGKFLKEKITDKGAIDSVDFTSSFQIVPDLTSSLSPNKIYYWSKVNDIRKQLNRAKEVRLVMDAPNTTYFTSLSDNQKELRFNAFLRSCDWQDNPTPPLPDWSWAQIVSYNITCDTSDSIPAKIDKAEQNLIFSAEMCIASKNEDGEVCSNQSIYAAMAELLSESCNSNIHIGSTVSEKVYNDSILETFDCLSKSFGAKLEDNVIDEILKNISRVWNRFSSSPRFMTLDFDTEPYDVPAVVFNDEDYIEKFKNPALATSTDFFIKRFILIDSNGDSYPGVVDWYLSEDSKYPIGDRTQSEALGKCHLPVPCAVGIVKSKKAKWVDVYIEGEAIGGTVRVLLGRI